MNEHIDRVANLCEIVTNLSKASGGDLNSSLKMVIAIMGKETPELLAESLSLIRLAILEYKVTS